MDCWYDRLSFFCTRTEQGWMIELGAPSVGQLIRNKMSTNDATDIVGCTRGVFNIGQTIGM